MKHELTESQLDSFRAVKRLTKLPIIEENNDDNGCGLAFKTCPYYYYNPNLSSGQEALRVSRAMNWKDKGQFSVIEEPTYAMIQAIETMESGYNSAKNHIHKREEIEAERERDEWLKKMDGRADKSGQFSS